MSERTDKKKILIINNNMHLGGVQRSLASLLKELVKNKDLSITLLLFYNGGELLNEIPSGVEIMEAGSAFRYLGMTKQDTKTIKDILCRSTMAAFTKLFGRDKLLKHCFFRSKNRKGFDCAISFLHSGKLNTFYGGCNEYLINCAEAKRKVTFLHCDYESIGADCEYNTSLYDKVDLVAACSEGCKKAFLRVLPQFENKTAVVPNCHDYEAIMESAEAGKTALPNNGLNILTVGRMGREKGILRAVQAIGNLDFPEDALRYYIVGNGIEYGAVSAYIEEKKLKDKIILLGEMLNPYGYMRAADILLIPSVSEAAPLVINESAFLGTPVLSTDTSSALEMIKEKGIGWVCENSTRGIEDAVKALVDDPESVKKVRKNLQKAKFDNSVAIESFYRVVIEE